MEVIDIVHKFGYEQWIKSFVADVLDNAHIERNKTVVYGIFDKKLYLSVDGQRYMIHLKEFFPKKKDQKHMTSKEDIVYTLHIVGSPSDTDPAKEISSGTLSIEWDNDPIFFKSEFSHINFYRDSKYIEELEVGDYLTLFVDTVDGNSFNLEIDISCYNIEERQFIAAVYGKSQTKKALASDDAIQLIVDINKYCINRIVDQCFSGIEFDLNYTRWFLRGCYANKLCSRKRMIEEENTLSCLYEKYKNGDETALDSIKHSLTEFIGVAKPFYAIICAD